MQSEDEKQLELLAVFHFIWAAPLFLMSLLPIFHLSIGILMLTGRMNGGHPDAPPMALFGAIFTLAGGLFIALGMTCVALNIISGFSLRRRTRKPLSLVTAGLNCLFVPLGTVLGVFTIVVLMRESVGRLYAASENPPPLPGETGPQHAPGNG